MLLCGAGTLACSAETHLGACQSVQDSRRVKLVFHLQDAPPLAGHFEETTSRERNCVLGRWRKRLHAEMSLGAAGKSACATKPQASPRVGILHTPVSAN